MPFGKSKSDQTHFPDAEEIEHRRRGVIVVLENVPAVPKRVRETCDRGWHFESMMYSGVNPIDRNVNWPTVLLTFRWPTERL